MQFNTRGWILVTLTALISGLSIFLNKFGVSTIDATLFTGLKNITVGILFAGLIFYSPQQINWRNITKSQWVKLFFLGLIGGSIPFVLFFHGLKLTSSLHAGFIHKTLFIYVALLAVIFLKEKLTKYYGFTLLAMLLGLLVFSQVKPFILNYGDWLVLLATLLWSIEIIIAKKLLHDLPANVVALARMFLGGILIWFYLIGQGGYEQIFSLNFVEWRWVVITSLLLFGYVYTFYHGLKYIPASVATVILTIAAPITALLNFGFFSSIISSGQWWGLVIIFISFYLLSRRYLTKQIYELK